MLNYQKIDTNMSNYAYIFKDSSFVEKAEIAEDNGKLITYVANKEKDILLNESELNYLYVTTKK